jgi:long-subunit fatty acid transport protein
LTIGLGQEVAPDIYVGLGVDLMRGDYETSERWVYPPDSEEENATARAEYNSVSGTRFTLGVLSERYERVDLAAVYRAPFILEGDYDVWPVSPAASSSGDFEYKYPGTLALGLEYHPRNLLMTTVSCDVEFAQWSEFEDRTVGRVRDPKLDDTVTYRIGVEHGFFDNTFARFGFRYQPSYTDKHNTTAAFSLGLGLDLVGVRVDIGGQVGLREYQIEEGRVRETTTLAMATVTHTF